MHQLAKAVIIFDEIQSLPLRCVHMFCNSVNFLVNHCNSTVVLCTATQPLLGEVEKLKGALELSSENEIIPDVQKLFEDLKRVEVLDSRKPSGWSDDEIADLAILEMEKSSSCLVIVNMKRSARAVFNAIAGKSDAECFHLSTGMCPVHRKTILKTIRECLASGLPTICISTQLIEAGVDVDFGSVIRFAAGLDSIAQAAGRCNRNGKRTVGRVQIINPAEENIDCLKDIAVGKEKTERVLNDFKDNPAKYHFDIIGPSALSWYYKNYFFERKKEMDYPISQKESIRTDTLLNLLSTNTAAVADYGRVKKENPAIFLRQAFMSAADLFRAIDAPTQGVIVQYGNEGENLVAQLASAFDVEKQFALLRRAQQYSVNLFPHEFKILCEQGALLKVQENTDIFYLDKMFYSKKFGISMEPVNMEELRCV